jgi:competence protein ComGF
VTPLKLKFSQPKDKINAHKNGMTVGYKNFNNIRKSKENGNINVNILNMEQAFPTPFLYAAEVFCKC